MSHPLTTLSRAKLDRNDPNRPARNHSDGDQPEGGGTMSTITATPLKDRLRDTARVWAHSQYELVTLAAEFADSGEWLPNG